MRALYVLVRLESPDMCPDGSRVLYEGCRERLPTRDPPTAGSSTRADGWGGGTTASAGCWGGGGGGAAWGRSR
jgi:hypothetical protein